MKLLILICVWICETQEEQQKTNDDNVFHWLTSCLWPPQLSSVMISGSWDRSRLPKNYVWRVSVWTGGSEYYWTDKRSATLSEWFQLSGIGSDFRVWLHNSQALIWICRIFLMYLYTYSSGLLQSSSPHRGWWEQSTIKRVKFSDPINPKDN